MTKLDVVSLLGSRLGEGLYATSVTVIMNCIVVVGTDAGCILAFSRPGNEADVDDAGVCVYGQALHHGPVYSFSVSTSHFFASAGYDAAPVVQPVFNLLTNGAEKVCRLSGHTLPVVAMTFFSTGTWLATTSLDGRFIIFDVVNRSFLCDLRVGFSVRCLALSPDETTCFVGGTQFARIDMYNNDRPVDPLTRRSSPLWLQRYMWSCDGESFVAEAPEDLFIAQIVVAHDKVTAVFRPLGVSPNSTGGGGGATATWSYSASDFWLSRNFCRVEDGPHVGAETQLPPFSQIYLEDTGKDALPVKRAHDGWDTWRQVRVRLARGPSLLPAAGVGSAAVDGSADECLASEKERGRALQAECDELVSLLRAIMKSRKKKRLQASSTL